MVTQHLQDEQPVSDLAQALTYEQKQKALISGHMPFGLHTYLEHPRPYITFLRHPVERLISYYHYVRTSPDNKHFQAANKLNLADYIASGLIPANALTRRFAGYAWGDAAFDVSPSVGLTTAKQNLETHFVHIGLIEKFDTSLLLLQRSLGWKTPFYMRFNKTKGAARQQPVSDQERQQIAEHCALDLEFYNFAVALFEQDAANYGPTLSNDVAKFERQNKRFLRIYSPYLKLRRQLWRWGTRS